jgi:hypothetical protein
MAVLPYFIAPLSPEKASQTLVAHKARGFCFYVRSEREDPTCRSLVDLPHTLGLLRHLSFYAPIAWTQPLTVYQQDTVLRAIKNHWVRDLGDLDMNWISLSFRQLDDRQRAKAFELIDAILDRSETAPLSWRYTHMKSLPADSNIPQDVMNRLEMSLASLEQALLDKDPMMPQHLRNTHSLLISYPETVHLLADDEIARIIDAAELHTKTEIVKAVAKGTSASGTRKKVSADDL